MCLILIAYKTEPDHDLIVLSNRDEFYDRPTKCAHFWDAHPQVLAGLDERHGGTWLGVTTAGRIAILTNYREAHLEENLVKSRGELVREFLIHEKSPDKYLEDIAHDAADFAGFNLVVGDQKGLYYFSNRSNGIQELKPGIYGLSNHLLDTPWPKVVRLKEKFSQIVTPPAPSYPKRGKEILADTYQPLDEHLPDTGVGIEWERTLAPIFITAENYGTRTSTVITMSRSEIHYCETTHGSRTEEKEFRVIRHEGPPSPLRGEG